VGSERIGWLYPFKKFIEAGLTIGFSTDAPVENPDPRETVYAAENRGCSEDSMGKPYCDEKLDRIDSLHAYTSGSARLLLRSDLGELSVGKRADFIVVGENPLEIEDFRKTWFKSVYVDGVRVS